MALTAALLILGGVLGLAGFVWLVVSAFRVGVGWGLAVLLLGWTLVPLIVFALRRWPAARRPLLLWGAGVAVSVVAWAAAWLVPGAAAPALPSAAGAPPDGSRHPAEAAPGILPPPRPTARPTPPSWEAVVNELRRDEEPAEAIDSWEAFVPDPDAAPAPTTIPWQELPRYAGRRIEIDLANGTEVAVQLVGVEADRIRVRQIVGGGAVGYWIARDQILAIRPPG